MTVQIGSMTLDIRALAGYPPANTDILTQPEADRIMAREHDRRLADIWAGRMTCADAAVSCVAQRPHRATATTGKEPMNCQKRRPMANDMLRGIAAGPPAPRMTPEEAADVIAAYSADPFDGCSGDGSTLDASSHPAQERKERSEP